MKKISLIIALLFVAKVNSQQNGPVTVNGGHTSTTMLLQANNDSFPHAYLSLWASEPQFTWTGAGIGNNIGTVNNVALSRIDTSKGASYMRLLEGEINFTLVSAGGSIKQTLVLGPNGNASLQGKFEAKEVKVTTTPTADFVFEEEYKLPNLEEVEKHIKLKKHLPEIASAKVMEKDGVNIGEFQIKLLQKIEELTLYSIEQNKQIKKLQSENNDLKRLKDRVDLLEKAVKN